MKQFYFKFEKKTFFTLFLGMFLLLVNQGIYATGTFTTTTTGGAWSDPNTWVGSAPPAVTTSSDIIIINGDVTLTLNSGNTVLSTANTPNRYTFSIGSITIAQGKTLNVTSLDGSATIPYYFSLSSTSVPSTINGNLSFDGSIFGGKTVANLTVSATGSFVESKIVSISNLTGTALTNYGMITTATLAPGGVTSKIDNYGTINFSGFSSSTLATTTNYSGGTLNTTGSFAGTIINNGTINSSGVIALALAVAKIDNYGTFTSPGFASSAIGTFTNYAGGVYTISGASGGTIAGIFKNYGTVTSAGFSGSAPTANFYNYSTGVLNFSGGTMTATYLNLYVSDPGNTVNYNAAVNQTIKLPADASYSNIIFSNAGTKTIPTAASGTLCTGTLSITDAAKASITNTSVGVGALSLGGVVQPENNTYGGLSSTANIKNSTYFSGAGYLNVQTLGVTSFSANEMKLYPNPSIGGKFTISLPSMQQDSNVLILNLAGETLYKTTIPAGEISGINPNLALATGIYLVKMEQAGNSITKKLIIQ